MKYKQGIYIPKKPDKWVLSESSLSDSGIFMRSGWETRFAKWCDNNDAVKLVSSEPFAIKYYYEPDGKWHRYYIDFLIRVENKSGELKDMMIEVKPKSETKPPRKTKKKTAARYNKEMLTYIKNKAKWNAAVEYGKKNNMTFHLITEKELGL